MDFETMNLSASYLLRKKTPYVIFGLTKNGTRTVISFLCTNRFTDACICSWKLIYTKVYGKDITELGIGGDTNGKVP